MIFDYPGPPWHLRQTWQAANASVAYLFEKNQNRLKQMTDIAGHIYDMLLQLDAFYEPLCSQTCHVCQKPCCLSADVWFDLKDILFFHAATQPIALESPRKLKNLPCSFLSSKGCVLPRTSRPWICTWYLCPAQKQWLKTKQPCQLKAIENLTRKIGIWRKKLEACFIELTK
jgi:hypothetical protein